MRPSIPAALMLSLCLLAQAGEASSITQQDFSTYGGNAAGTRYSALTKINRKNVSKLEVAWQYDTGEGRGDSQTQPIVIDGTLYGVTPQHHIIALNGATGELLWKFDSGISARGPNRGVAFWSNGSDRRILAGVQSFLYALDASTGKPIPSFGVNGRIDLREGLGRDPSKVSVVLTSPGIIFKDLIIVGGRMPEALPSAPGDIRAYDVRTGQQRWAFHTVPRPGEPGYETWPKDAWTYTGSVNNWAGMALDIQTGIVYAPTGSAASDFYGSDRLGDNLYANTLLALDAATGKRIWHFQAVKHDIWDRDFPSPPTLVTVKRNGASIPGIAQTSKQGRLYLFNRKTGEPLVPLESKNYPTSDVPDEQASISQSLPSKPAPFARQQLTADMLTDRTPEAHEWAVQQFKNIRSEGQFLPFTVERDTIIFPGFDGGAEWGGSAYDPETGLLYMNANDIPWIAKLLPNVAGESGQQLYKRNCAVCHTDSRAGAPPQIPSLIDIASRKTEAEISTVIHQGAGRMPAFPALTSEQAKAIITFLTTGEDKELKSTEDAANIPKYRFGGYRKFQDPQGYPAAQPPWGTLNAINVSTGEYAWKQPLGEYPELVTLGKTNTGSENYGGPVVTKSGLLIIAATDFDHTIRAFDKKDGTLLWKARLPAAGNATPAVYEAGGREFIVIYATGGKAPQESKAGGVYVAFALPKKR